VREKDGLWAVLCWLNILASKQTSVEALVKAHWVDFGRNVYSRHDYEAVPTEKAQAMMTHLRNQFDVLTNQQFGRYTIEKCDDFSYTDPVDGSVSTGQGLRLLFACGSRIIFRLSGTGTQGATIRLYLESFEPDATQHHLDAQTALSDLIDIAMQLSQLRELTGRKEPTVIT